MLAASLAVAAVAVLAVGTGGTAQSASAPWPGGRVAVLWPTFASGANIPERFRHYTELSKDPATKPDFAPLKYEVSA